MPRQLRNLYVSFLMILVLATLITSNALAQETLQDEAVELFRQNAPVQIETSRFDDHVKPVGSSSSGTASQIAHVVRNEFDGEKALATVAFLDQFVRWPGNRGFDASIDHVAKELEVAGFVREADAPAGARLTFRVEEYPMAAPAWEPIDASMTIEGESEPLLAFATNRNMLATRSFSTPEGGVTAELVDAGRGSVAELDALSLKGKIVMATGRISSLFQRAVVERGAVGVLAYSLPDYLKPSVNKHSIQFQSISLNPEKESWGIALSSGARDMLLARLKKGPVHIRVVTEVRWTRPAIERTVVADVHGGRFADERFVFSAHVQEPGANDNASGVGAELEMARVAARMLREGAIDPDRSITFLWGDEIRSTRRYVSQDSMRARKILWGMSLDMVGEDASKTGGTFLIEKMPDPSAIWTRGEEMHTEWGGEPLTKDDMTPHYFNDVVLGRALEQASTNGWVVKTNPYEGGSDHVPFLRAGIPGLLLWHFTDQFYHTDRDRLEMVSADELKNVGVTALATALTLCSADDKVARELIQEVLDAAISRLQTETRLSTAAIFRGGSPSEERDIIDTWGTWYLDALSSTSDIEVGGSSGNTRVAIETAQKRVREAIQASIEQL